MICLPRIAFVTTRSVGAAVGVTAPDLADCGPTPTAFRAATLKVYAFPFFNPVITCAVAVELNECAGCAAAPRKGVTT